MTIIINFKNYSRGFVQTPDFSGWRKDSERILFCNIGKLTEMKW
jgi:hypothetical protein